MSDGETSILTGLSYHEVNVRPAGTSLPLVMPTSEETTFQLDNPVYGTADELTAAEERLAAATPEHNLVNPLYAPIDIYI